MLSNVSINKLMKSRDIVIRPWNDKMMDAARVQLHLGESILIPDSRTVVDIVKGIIPKYRKIKTTMKKPFPLKPGQFIIAETHELIGISERIGMLLDGRSTLARLGLSVTQTAAIIDTGQKPKKMTLEIKNSGPNTILLYPKMKIGKGCFFLLKPKSTIRHDMNAKYLRGDSNKPIFWHELKEG